MYRTSIDFHKRILAGEIPIPYIVVHTDLGYRAYAEKELSLLAGFEENIADGSVTADGSKTAGDSVGYLERSARLLKIGDLSGLIQSGKKGLLLGYTQKEKKYLSAKLDNSDRYFSKLLPKEPFLAKIIYLYLCLEALPFSESLQFFKGTIDEITLGQELKVEAVET